MRRASFGDAANEVICPRFPLFAAKLAAE